MHDLLDALPLAVIVIDDERIVGWNAAAELLYGHERVAALGAGFVDLLFEPSDRRRVAELLATAQRGGSWEGDFRVCRRDGVLLVSEFRLAGVGRGRAAWLAIDRLDHAAAQEERAVLLSAEHAARATAEEALALLEAVLAAAPVGIAVLDPQLCFTRANDALAAMTGMAVADHRGQLFDEVMTMPPEVTADLRRVLTTGRSLASREVSGAAAARPDDLRHFVVNCYPVLEREGTVAGVGVTLIEITDRKRAEAERIVLLERAEQAQHRLALLATASSVLTSTMDVGSMLERLARVLAPSAADFCIIELIDQSGALENLAVAHQDAMVADELRATIVKQPFDLTRRGPIADVVASGRARLFTGSALGEALVATSRHSGQTRINQSLGLTGAILAPIEARGAVLGVLGLAVSAGRTFSDDDVDLAVELAHRAALALGNAKAYEQERHVAETLQRALLPSTLPPFAGVDVAVRYLTAADGVDVGGDWYDVIPLTDSCVGLVIGDVVGHDVRAASAMGQVRNALRAFVIDGSLDPMEAMARTDRLMDRLGLTLATGVLMVVDVQARTLSWANAGHPSPLLVRGARVRHLDDGRRLLLGGGWPSDTHPGHIDYVAGDTIVLYTDGLIERRGESLTDGLERLVHAAHSGLRGTVDELGDHLLAQMVPRDDQRDDDVALLVARFS